MLLVRKPGLKFMWRGDHADWDFATGAFTQDGALHELDLSAIVPGKAKLVQVRLNVVGSSSGKLCALTSADNTTVYHLSGVTCCVASVVNRGTVTVPISKTGIVKSYADTSGFSGIYANVLGWWY